MEVTKSGNGWHYKDDKPPKQWYKIKIIPSEEDKEPFVFKVETHDIEFTMKQYQRNREPLEWEMLNWNIRV